MSSRQLKKRFYHWMRYIEKLPADSRVTPTAVKVIDAYFWRAFGVIEIRSSRYKRRSVSLSVPRRIAA